MSVLIRGMKMPKNCVSCMWHHGSGVCALTGMVTNTGRDCPLVEVPIPHGRLIDADELEPDAEWSEWEDDYIAYSKAQIINAPTIIEAEDE